MTSLEAGPHYEIHSSELAAWLERQGPDRWWYADNDPLLGGEMALPAPADEIAEQLRKLDRPLLVKAKQDDEAAKGQVIDGSKLDGLVGRFAVDILGRTCSTSRWGNDRVLFLSWKGRPYEWILVEDGETTEAMNPDAIPEAK